MFIWSAAGVPLGVYTIVQNINIPIILQPQLFGFLAGVSWIQCLYYGNKKPLAFCLVLFAVYLLIYGGLVVGLTFLTRHLRNRGNEALLKFLGIFTSVLIAAGLIPQYIEIYKRKEVIGLSMTFISVDILGGVFSILSLAFKKEFDALAAVAYITVIVMDTVIVVAAIILNPRAKRRRAHEQEQEQDQERAGMQEMGATPLSIDSSRVSVQRTVIDSEQAPPSTVEDK
jgi:UDP-N-acetylmuramyl pentapeptide phosphotransferase/UDP-N-acetylglucosamine-1-phosphate transferase